MQKHTTTSLFYNKYIYKLSIRNEVASIFRGKNFSYAKQKIDEMQRQAESELPIERPVRWLGRAPRYITLEQFVDTAIIYKFLDAHKKDCMLRIEGLTLDIYSNEHQWLKDLAKQVDARAFYSPESDTHGQYLLDNANTVIVDKEVLWPYKVFFEREVDPSFASFCKANPKSIKIGKKALAEVENNGYCAGFYFYVKTDKTLMLASIASGNSFGRVVKYVSSQKLAK